MIVVRTRYDLKPSGHYSQVIVYLTDISQWDNVNKIYNFFFTNRN